MKKTTYVEYTYADFLKKCKKYAKENNIGISMYKSIKHSLTKKMVSKVTISESGKFVYEYNTDVAWEWFTDLIKLINSKQKYSDKLKEPIKSLEYTEKQVRQLNKKALQEIRQKEAYQYELKAHDSFKEKIKHIQSTGIFRNNILVGFKDEIPEDYKRYIGVKLIDNTRLEDFLKEPTYYDYPRDRVKRLEIEDYSRKRYHMNFNFMVTLVRYPEPLKLYLMSHRWDDVNNSFMRCFDSYVDDISGNEPDTISLRRIRNPFDVIDSLINPDYPVVSPRTRHGSVVAYKQGLFKLEALYNKTTDQFKEAIDDLLDYLKIDKSLFEKTIKEN